MPLIKEATDPPAINNCFNVINQLRPHLKQDSFVNLIEAMQNKGYRLIYIEEGGEAVAAAGYRITEHLAHGNLIYIDDLSTLPAARKKGHARQLLDYICNEARKNNCGQVHLDSGCNAQRYDAHRLYLKYGFNITSHHFAMALK